MSLISHKHNSDKNKNNLVVGVPMCSELWAEVRIRFHLAEPELPREALRIFHTRDMFNSHLVSNVSPFCIWPTLCKENFSRGVPSPLTPLSRSVFSLYKSLSPGQRYGLRCKGYKVPANPPLANIFQRRGELWALPWTVTNHCPASPPPPPPCQILDRTLKTLESQSHHVVNWAQIRKKYIYPWEIETTFEVLFKSK